MATTPAVTAVTSPARPIQYPSCMIASQPPRHPYPIHVGIQRTTERRTPHVDLLVLDREGMAARWQGCFAGGSIGAVERGVSFTRRLASGHHPGRCAGLDTTEAVAAGEAL